MIPSDQCQQEAAILNWRSCWRRLKSDQQRAESTNQPVQSPTPAPPGVRSLPPAPTCTSVDNSRPRAQALLPHQLWPSPSSSSNRRRAVCPSVAPLSRTWSASSAYASTTWLCARLTLLGSNSFWQLCSLLMHPQPGPEPNRPLVAASIARIASVSSTQAPECVQCEACDGARGPS